MESAAQIDRHVCEEIPKDWSDRRGGACMNLGDLAGGPVRDAAAADQRRLLEEQRPRVCSIHLPAAAGFHNPQAAPSPHPGIVLLGFVFKIFAREQSPLICLLFITYLRKGIRCTLRISLGKVLQQKYSSLCHGEGEASLECLCRSWM